MKKVTVEQAINEGWYLPNMKDGHCHCGCGEKTALARQTRRERGELASQPQRYVHGHSYKNTFGKDSARWKGGRKYEDYVKVQLSPDHPMLSMADRHRFVREHRLVMAEHLGRSLTLDEDVHHKNRDTYDNRLENLELFSHGKHSQLHYQEDPDHPLYLGQC